MRNRRISSIKQVGAVVRRYLLDDVPQHSVGVQLQQAILDGDSVEPGAFLVLQERVRDPDRVPRAGAEFHLYTFLAQRLELQPRIAPLLTQVHAYLVVLQ